MRRPTRARPTGATANLQIAPLIDAVFLLLTYFLFTISLSTIEGLLPSELAAGEEFQQQRLPSEEETPQLVVRLVKAGGGVAYFLGDWPVDGIVEVERRLAQLQPQDIVVIDAGSNVAYEYVIRVYNASLKAGVQRVVFPLAGERGSERVPRT